ncbi:hypothetical protein [Kitasatospora viridis]|uniref:Uncharacterized protein n=1 Tax=Kitasatospora viridis TaxID=281105 RepID=A0A561SDR5_9ACTN|nr:hypothetical protein [Kitasatospora viridis]TWF72975.1 hypothetical protein FHX73_16126 [Kitasatospora viridis]
MEQLPEGVDHDILENRIVYALKAIIEARGCTLPEAQDVFLARYEELRRDRPDDFLLPREEYGRNSYS